MYLSSRENPTSVRHSVKMDPLIQTALPSPVKCKLTTAGGQRKKVDIYLVVVLSVLLVFASLVDVAGKMVFDQKRIIKIKECQAISFCR